MSDISHAGLLYAHARQDLCVLHNLFADVGDNFFSVVQGHSGYNFLRLLCRLDRLVHVSEYAVVSCHI